MKRKVKRSTGSRKIALSTRAMAELRQRYDVLSADSKKIQRRSEEYRAELERRNKELDEASVILRLRARRGKKEPAPAPDPIEEPSSLADALAALKRYCCETSGYGEDSFGAMEECEGGDYVKFEDVIAVFRAHIGSLEAE